MKYLVLEWVQKIIPLLNSGAQGLRELTEEFEAVGYMSNEQVKSLAEFDNIMNRLKQMIGNFKKRNRNSFTSNNGKSCRNSRNKNHSSIKKYSRLV